MQMGNKSTLLFRDYFGGFDFTIQKPKFFLELEEKEMMFTNIELMYSFKKK